MELSALRRAFRARPGTSECTGFALFLGQLEQSEPSWKHFVAILETDVIPVVWRHHPATDRDEIASTCLSGAFETWVTEWLDRIGGAERVRKLLREDRRDHAFVEMTKHAGYRGNRAGRARLLWSSRRLYEAVDLIEGTQSARGHFIAKTRALIGEDERKRRRQSSLLIQNCVTALSSSAQPLNPETADRMLRMLGAIEALGPEHERVFKLLLEGLSQQSIAKTEGRHPAAISRRVQKLRELCRKQLLE